MPKIYKFIKVFLILLICIFQDLSHAAVLLDRVVAVVNKEVITWSELYKMMEYESTEQMKALKEEERVRIFKENEAIFLEKLIDMKLQIQEAKRVGLQVTPEEVTEAIQNIKQKYSLTDKALEESLKKEGLTFDEYKKRLSDQILVSHIVNREIRNKVIVSDEEVRKYIEANRERFSDSGGFKLRQIFLKKPKDEAESKTVEDKGSLIIQRLKAGEDFSALAKEYSQDPTSIMGGDLGYIEYNHMAKEFIDVLSTMNTGDFSKPFWTDKGLNIIKLDEIVNVKSQDEIKQNVRKQLAEEKFMEKYKAWVKGLRERAHIEISL
jgi:peptidyl-prolyl cis-trans isomerase SurA